MAQQCNTFKIYIYNNTNNTLYYIIYDGVKNGTAVEYIQDIGRQTVAVAIIQTTHYII